jgi:hypothetical protein
VQTGVTQALAGSYINNDGYEEWAAIQNPAIGVVPEPATALLLGGGLIALGWFRRKRI